MYERREMMGYIPSPSCSWFLKAWWSTQRLWMSKRDGPLFSASYLTSFLYSIYFCLTSDLYWYNLLQNETQSERKCVQLEVLSRWTIISWEKKVSCPIRVRSGSSGIFRNNLWERLKDINLQLGALATEMWATSWIQRSLKEVSSWQASLFFIKVIVIN